MKEEIKITYVSNDNRKFDSKEECLQHEKRVKRGAIVFGGGTINKKELERLLVKGYRLCNFKPNYLSIHNPECYGGGQAGEIFGSLANEFGKIYDSHNYQVHVFRGDIEMKR